MSQFPPGVQPYDDVTAMHVELHMTVHRTGRRDTACGESMAVMQPRFGAYLALGHFARWCERCFPPRRYDLVCAPAAAMPINPRYAARSHARPGVGQPTEGYR